jgi:hypothetical protein
MGVPLLNRSYRATAISARLVVIENEPAQYDVLCHKEG